MRLARNALLAVMLCLMTACDLCPDNDNGNGGTKNAATVCNGVTCTVVIHVSTSCTAVDASNTALDHLNADPGNTVCVFNDAAGSVTVQFPTPLIASPTNAAAPYQEFTLAHGECASFVIADTAKDQTFTYQITGSECPTTGDEHGNPDVIVGGGGGG
jgi:hypothetical protein